MPRDAVPPETETTRAAIDVVRSPTPGRDAALLDALGRLARELERTLTMVDHLCIQVRDAAPEPPRTVDGLGGGQRREAPAPVADRPEVPERLAAHLRGGAGPERAPSDVDPER